MTTSLTVQLNGQPRTFAGPLSLAGLLETLELQPDRIAVELNGTIAPRDAWPALAVQDADKLEIVHFVGGGLSSFH